YLKANETNPDPWAPMSELHSGGSATVRFPAADARDMDGFQMINSVGVYLVQAGKIPGAKAALGVIPSKLVTQLDEYGGAGNSSTTFRTVVDAWGKPIRYVHPAFQGTITGDVTAANPQPSQPRPTDQVLGSLAGTTPLQTYAMSRLRRNHSQTTETPALAQD